MKSFLRANYGITITSVEERNRGEMSDGFVINNKFFLKVMKTDRFSLEISNYLSTSLPAVVELSQIINVSKPIANVHGELTTDYNGRTAVLFEFINGVQKELEPQQYKLLGELLRKLHNSILHTQIRRDDFSITFKDELIKLLEKIPKHKEFVIALLEELENTKLEGEFVVCHTDCLEQNIIMKDDEIFLIDWDGICLSFKEKDLWFHSEHLRSLLKGYGETNINEQAMDYFYKMRVLTDLHEFLVKDEFDSIQEYIFREFKKMK